MTSTLDTFAIRSTNHAEYFLTSTPQHGAGVGIIDEIAAFLTTRELAPVSVRLFGADTALMAASALWDACGLDCPPVALVQKEGELQIQVQAVPQQQSQSIYVRDELIGREFTSDGVRYLMLRVLPQDGRATQADQMADVFTQAQTILNDRGAHFTDTIRTWLFADDILSWYDQLNAVRTAFFEQHGVFDRLVPASTGIGIANAHAAALATHVLAAVDRNRQTEITPVESPLQCSALDYRSSFSRAVKVRTPQQDRLYISGSASIDQTGRTVFLDDTEKQIEKTMQVVAAILIAADMDWTDTASALIYCKHRADLPLFDAYCQQHNLSLPHVKLQADVCRDNLLFEIELDAIRST